MHTFPTWPKSKEGCVRQLDALLRSYKRDFAGGGAFGWDWPTMRVNSPERFERAEQLRVRYVMLPSRHKGD